MNILLFLMSFVLILACLFLILLVLVQLPKKEAGLGQAFGSGTTDALFGPGSGNMLTQLTKWTAVVFFVLTLLIWVLQGHNARARPADPRSRLSAEDKARNNALPGADNAAAGATNQPGSNLVSAALSNAAALKPLTNAPTNATPAK